MECAQTSLLTLPCAYGQAVPLVQRPSNQNLQMTFLALLGLQ